MSAAGLAARGPLELSVGTALLLEGTQWQVLVFEPSTGRVVLGGSGGQQQVTTVRALVNHSDCWPARHDAGPGAQQAPSAVRAGGSDQPSAGAGRHPVRASDGGGVRLSQRQRAARPAR